MEKPMTGILRDHFPILAHNVYLNSCSYGALSHEVEAAFHSYLARRHEVGADWQGWMGLQEEVRALFARLIGAVPAEVAITTSASAGLDSFVSALAPQGSRNRIVVSDYEFPTVGQIWHAQERRGFEVVHVPEDEDGRIPFSRFEKAIDERTLAVSIAHVCYRHGAVNEIERIVRLAHANGAIVVLDAYQGLGQLPIDVHALDIDVLIGGALKYLLSSAGLGFLFVRKELIERFSPFVTGWFAQRDIAAMNIYAHDPAGDARRFETGTPPVPNLYAGKAGLELVLEVGIERIAAAIATLTARLKEGADELGARLATPKDPARHGAMIAIRSRDDQALVERLAERGIITSCRDGNLRVSPHFYNTEADIERLLVALADHRDLLA
ncbi:MAG: aminotransferase class V-fold PLP-dependent enzyme [Alphaproteobacteria bacterium]|nr:MAG: aminotransferase class V-fold PLP-dependent enzyme [Alphaproteobacteria bacterium]